MSEVKRPISFVADDLTVGRQVFSRSEAKPYMNHLEAELTKLRTERDRLMKKAKEAYMSYTPITPEMGELGSTLHEMGAFKRNEFDPEFAALHPTQQEDNHA